MRFSRYSFLAYLTLLSLLLASCRSATPGPGPNPTLSPSTTALAVTALPSETAGPTVTATAPKVQSLVVCVPDEPATLYPYGGSSRSMWSVLEAVYDGPFDTRGYGIQPVILEKIPAQADGDAQLMPVTVRSGDAVVDVTGNLVTLQTGVEVRPSGCSAAGCAVTWDGVSELRMDQLVVEFNLLPGLKWSDGQPLGADDSVFSYSLAADPATPVSKYLIDRTFSYKAVDELTVTWSGLPGYFDQRFGTYFWLPLPKHAWGALGAADLLQDEHVTRAPLGWGPYVIQEWVAGDHITLVKNGNYFRAAEGLPYFETLVYRFVGPQGDSAAAALRAGECDVVDQNAEFPAMFPGLLEQETQGRLKIYVGQGPEWEHLDFGIRPAGYDDGYNPASGDRPDLFGDVRTRQAFASCIDRQGIIDELLYRRSSTPLTFLPVGHPLLAQDLPGYAYDPGAGANLLDGVGWKDTDGDPNTPRLAQGVANIADGTALTVRYLTTEAALRQQTAERVAASLRGCGIGVETQYLNPGDLFAPGPEGAVFGRAFDLVQFSWEASARHNCLLYSSEQVPDNDNHWIGANITGFQNTDFDAACAGASLARPDAADFVEQYQRVQALFAQELPVIPLYAQLKVALSRPDLCGLEMDVTGRSILWNLEAFNVGEGCPK